MTRGDRRRGLSVSRAALIIGVPARTLRSWLPIEGFSWRASPTSPWQIDPRFVREYLAASAAVDELEAIVGNVRRELADVGTHVLGIDDDAA